jgi:hypothetical protein
MDAMLLKALEMLREKNRQISPELTEEEEKLFVEVADYVMNNIKDVPEKWSREDLLLWEISDWLFSKLLGRRKFTPTELELLQNEIVRYYLARRIWYFAHEQRAFI